MDKLFRKKGGWKEITQKVFTQEGLINDSAKIKPEDIAKIQQWSHITVDCPYCLLHDSMNKFATFTQGTKKYPKKLGIMMTCPECGQSMRQKTLRKVTDMTVEEFAWWFWENVFLYRMMNKVRADVFFNHIKENWGYKDKEKFWDIYKWYKYTDDRHNARKNYEDFMEYKNEQTTKIEEFENEHE
jgi:transposase-like protein